MKIRKVKLKNAYNSIIIGPRGLHCETNLRKSYAKNFLIWSNLTLGPSFKVE